MNKTFTIAALASLATIAAPAAQAGWSAHGLHFMDANDFNRTDAPLAHSMITSLGQMGIPVIDGGKQGLDVCAPDPDAGSYVLGYYVPADDYVVICTNVASRAEQFETLTHEVVHVIQDARDGLQNDSLVPYQVNGVSADKVETVTTLYPRDQWLAELEAFHFEDKPAAVASELTRWTF